MNCICNETYSVANYVGGENSTILLQLCHYPYKQKRNPTSFLTECFSGIADPLQKRPIIAWEADKYTQSFTTL